jgi:acyl-coenzyme A thioesterase PaaI-like protein
VSQLSLQQQYAPQSICFGCGPANPQGLQLRSFVAGDRLVADWRPQPYHLAFEGVLNGGIIGALLDCHCNWAAAWNFMQQQRLDAPPCTVTATYTIDLHHPTPADDVFELVAQVETLKTRSAVVRGVLQCRGTITARCRGVFVAVRPGHPAYHRW